MFTPEQRPRPAGIKVAARGFKRFNRQSDSGSPIGNAMALTSELAHRVIDLVLKRRMQDAADSLHKEAPESSGDAETALDAVDHEAVSHSGITLSMVKEALRNRGVSEEAIAGMSREQLKAERESMRARSEPTPEQADTGVKHATVDEDKPLRDNDASRNLHAKELWLSPSFAALRRRQRYRYMGAALIGIAIGSLITLSVKPRITYSDCILSHIDHASSQMAVYVTEHACAAKYPPAPGESAE